MGIGTLSAQTLKNCGIDERALMLEMARAIDIPNEWLPVDLRSKKSKHVNAASIIAKKEAEESELKKRNEKARSEEVKSLRILKYSKNAEAGEINFGEISEEQQIAIDKAYLECYAHFIELGIVDPITEEEIQDYEAENS